MPTIRNRCPDNAGDRPRCTSTGIHCLEGTKADGAPESCIRCKTYGEHAKHLRIERDTQFSSIDRFEAEFSSRTRDEGSVEEYVPLT
jgi:hypothetical protein